MKEQRGFVQKVPTGFCAGYFVKVPTTYLLGMSWANGWVLFECAHYLPAGYEPGELFQNPQLTHNVPTGYIALRPQCVDRLSKQGIFILTMDSVDSAGLAKLFVRDVFSKHGIPAHVTSDRGSEFMSIFFHSLGEALNMNLHFTSGYHPEADG